MKEIFIKGAKENNLKNIDLAIPRDKLVVFTGLSGSGKSSLAFDTIFAEGQRRYMESLSSYARQFLGQMQKPDVEYIEGLSPAVSIDQKTTSHNPRSTVGTVTEIYDYFRLLYARVGKPHCPKCGREIERQTVDQIADRIMTRQGVKLQIIAPVVRGRKGEYVKQLETLKRAGYVRVRVDGVNYTLDEEIPLDKNVKHDIGVVIDRLVVKEGVNRRLTEALETAVKLADGLVVADFDGEEVLYSTLYACPDCEISIEELTPRLFSFNNPYGACPVCAGLGFTNEIDTSRLIADPNASLRQGGIRASGWYIDTGKMSQMQFRALSKAYGFSLDTPVKDLPEWVLNLIFYGNGGDKIPMEYNTSSFSGRFNTAYEGIANNLLRRFNETDSEMVKMEISRYMKQVPCTACGGRRLKPEALNVTVGGKNIYEACCMTVTALDEFLSGLSFTATEELIVRRILKEIHARLRFLANVGLGYLTLARASSTLSGGESQRIRLATQIGSGLTGVLYILDEPSIGLHQKDNQKLLASLKGLRDLGNTLIVVEHDEETIRSADYIVDIGPGAGVHGGEVVAAGSVEDIIAAPDSVTGKYLSGEYKIEVPFARRAVGKGWLTLVDKRRLVPFGEYVPSALRWLPELFGVRIGDMTPGAGNALPQTIGEAKVATLICFENLFGTLLPELFAGGNDPTHLAVVSNLGWFSSAAKGQHLAISRLRAIESARPILSVNNNGDSSVIDAEGRVLLRFVPEGSQVETIIVEGASGDPTPFIRWGNLLRALLYLVALLFLLAFGVRTKRAWRSNDL